MKNFHKCLFAWLICLMPGFVFGDELKLHGYFTDHMVLQRDKPIRIKGTAGKQEWIRVTLADLELKTQVNEEGNWIVELPSMTAGGPYELRVSNRSKEVVLRDVMMGDVWLASGQSNMQYRIGQGVSSGRPSVNSNMRFFEVPALPASSPKRDLQAGDWMVCGEEEIDQFSAVAYYFADRIASEVSIPVGIVVSAWGGSPIEAWMPENSLAGLPHHPGPSIDPQLIKGRTLEAYFPENEAKIDQRQEEFPLFERGLEQGVHLSGFNDRDWESIAIPRWDELKSEVYWMRKSFQVSQECDGPVRVRLGYAPSLVHLFINGELVFEGSGEKIDLEVGGSLLEKGRNCIAMRISNPWFAPYLDGAEEQFFLDQDGWDQPVYLFDDWKASGSVEPCLPQFYSLQQVPSANFNGMIAPLADCEFKGVLWYQGENNGDEGIQYRKLFPRMIEDWRELFGQDLPFYFVQLANLGAPTVLPEADGWPLLREAQAMALQLPNTGMAVTIDVGDSTDIHPKDKKSVGERLARLALAHDYGVALEFSGPMVDSVSFNDAETVITFSHAEGLKTTDNGAPQSFALAGEDQIFYSAEANIEGNAIRLSCQTVPHPVAVRYAWSKNPITNLVNDAELPAVPFRTDDW